MSLFDGHELPLDPPPKRKPATKSGAGRKRTTKPAADDESVAEPVVADEAAADSKRAGQRELVEEGIAVASAVATEVEHPSSEFTATAWSGDTAPVDQPLADRVTHVAAVSANLPVRPASIFRVQHQGRAQRLLQRALAGERVPHAYVFHGPDGVGKELFARGLAKLLTCTAPLAGPPRELPDFARWTGDVCDACGRCNQCRLMDAQTHPDLHLIYRQLKNYSSDSVVRDRVGREIGVEVVREFLLRPVASKPIMARAKVFIVREADRITPQAQNALLKTLEEPPPATFIILLAAALDRLLPTTRSRCQLIPFAPLPTEFIAAQLRSQRPDQPPERVELLARLAEGSLGAALLLVDDNMAEYNERLVRTLVKLSPGDAVEVAKLIQDEAKSLGPRFTERDGEITDTEALRRGVKALLALASAWYRDVGLAGSAADELIANRGLKPALATAAQRLSPTAAGEAVKAITAAERQLDLNVNVQLCLEALFVKLSRLG